MRKSFASWTKVKGGKYVYETTRKKEKKIGRTNLSLTVFSERNARLCPHACMARVCERRYIYVRLREKERERNAKASSVWFGWGMISFLDVGHRSSTYVRHHVYVYKCVYLSGRAREIVGRCTYLPTWTSVGMHMRTCVCVGMCGGTCVCIY